jgi:hypothetical protein
MIYDAVISTMGYKTFVIELVEHRFMKSHLIAWLLSDLRFCYQEEARFKKWASWRKNLVTSTRKKTVAFLSGLGDSRLS